MLQSCGLPWLAHSGASPPTRMPEAWGAAPLRVNQSRVYAGLPVSCWTAMPPIAVAAASPVRPGRAVRAGRVPARPVFPVATLSVWSWLRTPAIAALAASRAGARKCARWALAQPVATRRSPSAGRAVWTSAAACCTVVVATTLVPVGAFALAAHAPASAARTRIAVGFVSTP